ncbi:MAG: asparagine synthase (glutamine-hydrolyzing), partial [Tannerella sp.]|jgi:asparagine synthase (glutamine-hydrolysing)|nr:asparagine synthase (glutamine-hydrolyzing) [Tannerella sp.]
MFSQDGRYVLVYNGEIYNYLELRTELEREGIRFRSSGDTEVLLQALIHRGKACLPRLTGMFAFAFYDAREQKLLLARDYFGIKPLYWSKGQGNFSFASELPALLCFAGVSRKLSAQSVYNYLCFTRYDKGGDTFFRDIFQLPPACCMTVDTRAGSVSAQETFWKPDLSLSSPLSFADAAARMRELFLESVRLHLRSDVPLGVALSGGIDSSSVACAMRHLRPDAALHTFSFTAEDSPVSEERWASLTARHIGAVRHTVEVKPDELVRDMDDMLLRQGEPFGSTSIYAQYRVFRLARESGIKVTLDGQGADELLAGYWGYPGQRVASLLLHGDITGAWRFLRAKSSWPGSPMWETVRRAIREFTPARLIPFGLRLTGRDPMPDWLDIQAFEIERTSFTTLDDKFSMYPGCKDRVRQTLAYLLTWEGLQMLLRHGDRNSMAFSIESRVPFLTRDMAEFCLSLPEDYLIDMNGRTKSVFREAMRGIVPDAILDRRDKIGFATPELDWLNALSTWVEKTLESAGDIPYLRFEAAKKEWSAIKAGKKTFDRRVWRWLNYVRWVQLFKAYA